MKSAFHYQLSALIGQLAEMCAMAAKAISDATYSLLHADIGVAQGVIAAHQDTDAMGSAVQETTFLLLALQTPGATDLRAVVNAMIAADVQRMHELAVHIAETTRRHNSNHAVPEELRAYMADMGAAAAALARTAQETLLSRDSRRTARTHHDGDMLGKTHRKLLAGLIDKGWTHNAAAGVDIALLAGCYQLFADHAIHIIRRATFRSSNQFQRPAMTR